jgi:hypothetical protein
MNYLQRILLMAALSMSLSLGFAGAPARAAGREISGELVILKTGNRQFRIVDHGGSFTAPAGVSLEEFDGKPVRVELGSGGQVLSITEKPIETNPLMRNYQIVTGQLVVTNAAAGSFTIAGDGRSYLAPLGVDVRPYANQMVDVFIDEQGQVKSIDRAKNSALPVAPVMPYNAGVCSYNGLAYEEGVLTCQSNTRYRCEAGVWRSVGGPCTAGYDQPCNRDGANYAAGSTRCESGTQLLCQDGIWRDLGTTCVSDVTTASARPRSCMVGDATVGSGSTICRSGVTYRCSDGSWNDLGTACR